MRSTNQYYTSEAKERPHLTAATHGASVTQGHEYRENTWEGTEERVWLLFKMGSSDLLGTCQADCAGQVLKVADNHGRFGDIRGLCVPGESRVVIALLTGGRSSASR